MKKDWVEQYWRYMAASDFENAMLLKGKNFPASFFKYRSLSTLSLENIQDNYIWLADIVSLNDPFECALQFDNDACLRLVFASAEFQSRFTKITGHVLTNEDISAVVASPKPFELYLTLCNKKDIPNQLTQEDQLKRLQVRGAEIVDEGHQNLAVCSFCLVKDSLLLWSHYSSEHKGICIEYDFENVNIINTFIQPVNYRNTVHKIGTFEDYTSMQVIAASLIKSEDWLYEQEWRFTMFKKHKNFIQKFPVPSPKAIYLGTRFHLNDEPLKKSLFQLAAERKIPLFQIDGKTPRRIQANQRRELFTEF